MAYSNAVIMDPGSGLTKVGFAGKEAPLSVFPTVVGEKHYMSSMFSNRDASFVGHRAISRRGILKIKLPVELGIITDWDLMETVFRHAFDNELPVAPEENPVLVTLAPKSPKAYIERMAQLMFEKFNVPALCIANQAKMSLRTVEQHTGLVVDCGDDIIHFTPIYDGFVIWNNNPLHSRVTGRELTEYLTRLLRQNGRLDANTYCEREIGEDIKETQCQVLQDFDKLPTTETSYELPDGQVCRLGSERFQCPEAMFKPSLCVNESSSLHQLVRDNIMCCDSSIHRELFENILLVGGSSLFPGLAERLQNEVAALCPNMNVKVTAPANREFSTWIGGSITASQLSASEEFITKSAYDECGPSIVEKFCQ